jgi:histidinol phosphatase-like PHP family hydrolase
MNWQPVDCHAHSTFSDGALTIAEVVERAAARGVRPSVSDHISKDVSRSLKSLGAVREYLDALDQFPVLRGGEFCWHDSLWRELPDDVTRRFTHRLGSLHAIRLSDDRFVHAFSRDVPSGLTAEMYMDGHADSLEQFAREMPVDILAHPTLVALPFRGMDADALWTEERETRLVDALFNAHIAFEISSRYPPHERLVRRAIERGVRISLGSDGHTREQVAEVTRPLALARQLGVRDEELYDPTRHGSKTARSTKTTVNAAAQP